VNLDGVYDFCEVFDLMYGSPRTSWEDVAGGNISVSCPLAPWTHGDPNDQNLSCSISYHEDAGPSKVKCFSGNCGWGGMLWDLMEKVSANRAHPDHLKVYLDRVRPLEEITLKGKTSRVCHQLNLKREAWAVIRPETVQAPVSDRGIIPEERLTPHLSDPPHSYILQRGVSEETCKKWEIGFDTFQQRITFPVRRYDGKLVGISGRALDDDVDPRYRAYGGLDKKSFLYGEHFLKLDSKVILVEGQIDALRVAQATGLPVVAPLGEGFSPRHVKTLTLFRPECVILFPDHDSAGWHTAEKWNYQLHGRTSIRLVLPPPRKDPGDLTDEEIQLLVAAAKPVLGKKIKWPKYVTKVA